MIDWRVPHDADAEAELIGWMLRWPSERARVTRQVTAADLYIPAWQNAFTELAGSSESMSVESLAVKASAPADRLAAALDAATVSPNAVVESILGLSLRRRVLGMAGEAQRLARDAGATDVEMVDFCRGTAAGLAVAVREIAPPENVADFVQGADAPDWLVEDVLERGDRVIVVGAEGRGKSTLQRQIAVQCAAGLHPFRPRTISPLRVLLVDLESGDRMVRRKLRPLWLSARQENEHADPNNLRVVVRSEGVDLTKRSGRIWMTELLNACKPDLVCLGPIYKTYSGDMNEEPTARQVALLIDEWRAEYGCAWLLETHAPHGEQGRRRQMRPIGSSLWLRWPEMGVGLNDTEEDDLVALSYFRFPRDDRDWPRRFRKGGLWPWTAEWS